ncbi:MAG: YfhO family protein [Thermodesulfobacteriota bacterium]
MMFFRRAILRPGFRNEIFTAIFITISFLGGGLEIVYGNFIVLFLMVIFTPLPGITFIGEKNQHYHFLFGARFNKFFQCAPIYWGRMKPLFERIRSLFIVCVLFLFLSAIQLIPFLEVFIHSIRGNGISYLEATIWSFAPKDFLLFFIPDAYGYFLDMKKYWVTQCWFKTLYTGGLPFILSLIFFLAPLPHRGEGIKERPLSLSEEWDRVRGLGKDRKLYLALILFSLFLSLGKYNPLYIFIFKYVPFFNGIRYPAKFLYIFIFILSVTAGLGFQRLTEVTKEGNSKKLKRVLITLSLGSGVFLLFLVLGHKEVEHFIKLRGIDFPDFNYLAVNLHHAKRFLFYLALFFLLLRFGFEVGWKNWIKVLLIVFLATDLFGNMGFYGKEKTSDYLRKTQILEIISQDHGHFRVFSTAKTISLDTPVLVANATPLDILKEKHLPSMNLLYQLHDMSGIDVIKLKRVHDLYRAFSGTPSISATNLVDLYGLKYVISVIPIEGDRRFELIYSGIKGLQGKKEDLLKENTIKLYKNRSPILRGWLVKDFKVMDAEAMLSRMTSKDFHPDKEVLLEEEPPQPIRSVDLPTQPSPVKRMPKEGRERWVEFISESNNRLRLLAKAPEHSFLVLNDTYFPGWKAFVDGKRTKIYRADYTFRAIPVNAGVHQVEFVYDPWSFKLGAAISIFGVTGCVAICLIRRKPNNKKVKVEVKN